MTQQSTCTVCAHPMRETADEMLRKGRRKAAVARVLGDVTPMSVSRHELNGHVPPDPAALPAPDAAPPADGDEPAPLTEVEHLEKILRERAAEDVTKLSPRDRAVRDEIVRKTAESLARARPPVDREGPAQEELRLLKARQSVVMKVLDRHPDVRAEVASALSELRKAEA